MHVELLVPGLMPRRAGALAEMPVTRLPGLELLLARARATSAERLEPEAWLADAFALGSESLPAGALTRHALEPPAVGGEAWVRADPVHLRLMRDHMALVPGGFVDLTMAEAIALCDALNAHFDARIRFEAVTERAWCAHFAEDAPAQAASPYEAASSDIDALLAGGTGATAWHALLNEIQMLLYTHPVNEAREEKGATPVNSLWFWGAGALPASARAQWQSVRGDDPVLRGLGRLASCVIDAAPVSADAWLRSAPADGRHLLILEALRLPQALGDGDAWLEQLQMLEARWFAPLLEALRANRIGMITLQAPDGEEAQRFEVIRGDLRRFWRRPKPLGDWSA